MSEKITGIVLNVRKYNDRSSVVTLYTRSRGRLSFLSPMGSGKASNARRARLQPLSLITTDLKFKSTVELQHLGSISSPEVWNDLYFNPLKLSLAIFISEFLYRLLNAEMADPELFDFIVESLRLLDRMERGVADFHIPFLVSLLSFSGIQPNTEGYEPGKVFDFNSGSFLWPEETAGPVLSEEESPGIFLISRINFSNIKRLRLSNANRRQIISGLLNYYAYHFPGIGNLKSPEILRELFE